MNFTLNGKKVNVIDSWEGLNFSQYLRGLKAGTDLSEIFSIITGVPAETIKKAKIEGLDKLMYAARFLNDSEALQKAMPEKPTKVGKYKLPVDKKGVFDVQFESLEQFEDMRQIMTKLENGIYAHTEAYAKYTAIYLQKIREKEYDGAKAMEMVEEVMLMPALEVVAAGSFFFVKLQSLLNGTRPVSRHTRQLRRKAIGKRSQKRSGLTPR